MNQLLNSGMDYGMMPRLPHTPDDDRTDEEKDFRTGCATFIAYAVGILLGLFFCGLLGSCATHRNVCGITTAEADSLAAYINQTASVVRQDSSVAQTATVFNSSVVETTEADEEETETVTEQITVITDSLGRTTTTTNRSTTRKRKTAITSQSLLDKYAEEVALKMHLSELDSMYGYAGVKIETHWADSTYRKEEKQSGAGYHNAIGNALRTIVYIILAAFIVLVGYKLWQYIKAK